MASRAHSRAPSLGGKKDNLPGSSSSSAPVIGDDPIDPSAPQVKQTDMPRDQQLHATQLADKTITDTLASPTSPTSGQSLHNTVARVLKKEFDSCYGGVWQCVVGRNFGSFVVHDSQTFIYFYIGPVAVLLFRAGTA